MHGYRRVRRRRRGRASTRVRPRSTTRTRSAASTTRRSWINTTARARASSRSSRTRGTPTCTSPSTSAARRSQRPELHAHPERQGPEHHVRHVRRIAPDGTSRDSLSRWRARRRAFVSDRDGGSDRGDALGHGHRKLVPHHDRRAHRRVRNESVRRRQRGGHRRVAPLARERVGHELHRVDRIARHGGHPGHHHHRGERQHAGHAFSRRSRSPAAAASRAAPANTPVTIQSEQRSTSADRAERPISSAPSSRRTIRSA